uniref:Uncharacterized protein n=1 Tax=Oryza meridionalis TaxID=40149 RepID=A0A0E0F505_9ORYZ
MEYDLEIGYDTGHHSRWRQVSLPRLEAATPTPGFPDRLGERGHGRRLAATSSSDGRQAMGEILQRQMKSPAGIFFGMALLERFGLQQIDLHNMFAEFRGFQLPGRSTAGGSQLIAELMLLVVNTLLQGQTAGCGFSSLEG